MEPVYITLYRWAGSWGPFKVKIPCGECSLTKDVLEDTFLHELEGIPIKLEMLDWLSWWWRPLKRGGWHAPIVMVEDRVISQGHALNRGVLTQAVIEASVKKHAISGNHLFGKDTCPHCKRAKGYLEDA
ncbi:MAG: glutaredoxin, partial [Candidatus Thiodiazotropha sp. (ex Notomyrtea botanica)]|nr:glutaredoxin [Candidatus Thiodiazotropha sp. (ex Notomyrtea botanica)]